MSAVRIVDDTVVRIYHWRDRSRFIELAGPNQDHAGVALLEDLAGLWAAPITLVEIITARLPGSIPVTVRREKRVIDLAAIVQADNSFHWQQFNRNLWEFLSPTEDSLMAVQTLLSGVRWMKVRRGKSPDDPFTEDPTLSLSHVWNLQLVAHDPDWRSRDLRAVWDNRAGTGQGILRVAYRGDRPSFPRFAGISDVAGTIWQLQDGPGGNWNPLPAMAKGETFVVNSHPMAWQLTTNLDPNKWEKLQRGFTTPFTEAGEYEVRVRLPKGGPQCLVGMQLEQRHEYPWG